MTALLVSVGVGVLVLAVRRPPVGLARYLGGVEPAAPTSRRRRRLPRGLVPGVVVGALIAIGNPGQAPMLSVLGGAAGVVVVRAAGSTARQRRQARLVQELPTVADTLALHVLAGASVTSAITALCRSCRGVAVDELTTAASDPEGLELGLHRAAAESAHPDGQRLYDLLGHAHRTGGRLAESLGELAIDYRARLTADLTAEGGRRALTAYGPILAFMIPVTLLFLMYPTLAGLSALSANP